MLFFKSMGVSCRGPWISRASGWQTKRADCNYVFEKIIFLENYLNKDKSVGL